MAGGLSSPDLVLKAWRILREPVVFRPCQQAERMGSDGGEAWYQLQQESHNQQRRAACKTAFSSDLLISGLFSPQSALPGDILTDPKVCLLDSSKPNQVDNPE